MNQDRKLHYIHYLTLSLALFAAAPGYSQQNNNWVWGYHAGLDFNQTPAQPIYTGIEHGTPCAAVSDGNGQLLFYTNGDYVYNQNHEVMLNGEQLIMDPILPPSPGGRYVSAVDIFSMGGNWTALGGTVITPMPGNRYCYYIFSLIPQGLAPYQGRLYYSIVNMELDGGLGAVETKSILLDSGLVAQPEIGSSYCGAPLDAIHGEYCNVWLLALKQSSQYGSQLRAYNITNDGISAPVSSLLGMGAATTFCVSPDRSRIAFTNKAMLFHFDPASGTIVGDGLSLNATSANLSRPLSLAFSGDGSKLYFGEWLPSHPYRIIQYDLNSANIESSRIVIDSSMSVVHGQMRLGPDNKIYICPYGGGAPSLYGTIQYPDNLGAACGLLLNTPIYAAGATFNMGDLPRYVPAIPYDTITNYATVSTPMCMPVTLRAKNIGGKDYVWNDGARSDSLTASAAGIYYVQYFNSPCTYHVDSFEVKLLEVPEPHLGEDTTYCYGDLINVPLYAPEGTGLELLWSNGSQLPLLTVTDSGQYWLQVAIGDCKESDTLTISRMQCDCYLGMPNAFTPNGDGVNDLFTPLINPDCPGAAAYFFNVYNRFGQRIYSSVNPGTGWDGSHNGVPVDVGIYFYELGFDNILTGKRHHRQGDIALIR